MFLILGSRAVNSILFVVSFVCGHCGVAAAQRVMRVQQKVTLFFVPLFSLKTSYFVECGHCGTTTRLSRQQVDHSAQWVNAQDGRVRV
jgi:transcription elongation factor Elf1